MYVIVLLSTNIQNNRLAKFLCYCFCRIFLYSSKKAKMCELNIEKLFYLNFFSKNLKVCGIVLHFYYNVF